MWPVLNGSAVCRNFSKGGGGGQIWGMDKRGRGGGRNLCGVLHPILALGGGENDTRGEQMPPPP